MSEPLRWLHISDIHMGCPGKVDRRHLNEVFFESMAGMLEARGIPDLILITGDIGWHGKPEEYTQFQSFLDEIIQKLSVPAGKPAPIVIPVPGNHDLVRPSAEDIEDGFSILRKIIEHDSIGVASFAKLDENLHKPINKAMFETLFGNYQTWFNGIVQEYRKNPYIKSNISIVPGDFSLHLDLPDRPPLSIVGLNSAWLQITEGDYTGKLEILTRQYQEAVGKDNLSPNRSAFLLMHHPPAWLSQNKIKNTFEEFIYPSERFLLCLHGHMHATGSVIAGSSVNSLRYYYQAPSLFGLEKYGTEKRDRAFGYTWGKMEANGEIKIWPMVYLVGHSKAGQFKYDPYSKGNERDGFLFREGTISTVPRINNPAAPSLNPWLHSLLDRTQHIKISGIGTGKGRGKEAKPVYPIEDLYTTLKSRDERGTMDLGHESLLLQQLLPHHFRLLIEGAPGSGKTTFLKLVATMLARDLLGIPCPDGTSWRNCHLGLDDTKKPKIPLFLKLSELENKLAEKGWDDRSRLLDLLGDAPNASHDPAWRDHWETELQAGNVMLLLDGLDEVANPKARDLVFEIFQDALRHWKKCPLVVTSRPFETERLRQLGFTETTIAPFEENEIQEFLDHWVAALYGLLPGQKSDGEAKTQLDKLLQAIVERMEIRRMAKNPVMLTCLCVVHWNEGKLPEGRARVYQAAINWLIGAREDLRKEAGFTNEFADRAFPRLALAMMRDGEEKRTILGIELAGEAVTDLVARQCTLPVPEDARIKARKWLEFECLWSGILEESGQGQVRFWHLTFQEYLAARQLVWLGSDEKKGWWPILRRHLDDPQWRETVEMFPGCLIEGGDTSVDLLLQRVLDDISNPPTLASEARVAGIMGRLLATIGVYGYQPPSDIATSFQQLLTRTMAIFDREGAAKVPVKDRIAAAEVLGHGDPRLHELNLIPVPGTNWLLGKYPVTVMEYQRFVEHNGYQDKTGWDDAGWHMRMKEGWNNPDNWDEQILHPNRPVTGVSWFEAMAFCRWLSAQREMQIRLPDEGVWKMAATSQQGAYPWGKESPNPEQLANYKDGKVNAPTPVGVYPAGNGPHGHCDLTGNVWEWCRNLFNDKKTTATPLDPRSTSDISRNMRGGSWYRTAETLRLTYRDGRPAENRRDDIGFRVAALDP
ncbi:MAG: SUMF1/EgtB/PvdO family nonheme iron enzyme [Magnetococcus sp. DMHC-1]